MSTALEILRAGAQINLAHAQALLADIPAAQMAAQPGGVVNHPAWTLAHLLHYHPAILSLARREPVADPGQHALAKQYDAGSTPVAELSRYPGKGELLERFCTSHARIAAALRDTTAKTLVSPPGLARWVQPFGTTQYALTYLLVFHEAEHLGQLAAWRRALGLPPAG